MAASTTPTSAPEAVGLFTRPFEAREATVLWQFLRTEPGANAFLLGWLDTHGVGGVDQRFHFLGAFDDDGPVAAALIASSDVCGVSHGPPVAGASLADALVGIGAKLRTIAGPTAVVLPMLESDIGLCTDPMLLEQRVYVARPGDITPRAAPALREAVASDVPDLTIAGLAMHVEEVGRPVSAAREEVFRRGVEVKVSHGRTWVIRDPYTDGLMFKASVSASCPDVAQIEGVWVDPACRRRGLAREAVGGLVTRLFESHRMVSLYVGLGNVAARELYRGLGFRASVPYTSALFDR